MSNEQTTRYMAAAPKGELQEKFMFGWRTRDNTRVENINEFVKQVLNIPRAHELVSEYMILSEEVSSKILMVLHPYQIHAIEAIFEAASKHQSGYIWHATGSGKTITSFVSTKLLAQKSGIDRTIMLLDRKDLDSQTQKEYDRFSKGSANGNTSTKILKAQLEDKYENKIEFLFTENFKAKDVNEWYEHCIEKGLEDIKLSMPIAVKDPSLLAFSNTSQAGLVCYFKDNLVTYFIPKWEPGDKGWNVIYKEYKWENPPKEKAKFEDNTEDFKNKVLELAKIQKNVVLVINEPSHNPTGFRMTYEEWVNLMDFFKSIRDTNIIVIRDVAYFEYDDRGEEETKKIRKLLVGLPKNILFMYAFSLSKSLSIYGMRIGAQIAVSSDEEVIQEFKDALPFSCRTTWSNIPKGGMKLFATIMKNPELKANFLNEKQGYMDLLNERANIFLAEAKEVNLELLPYKSGFFVTVPVGKTVDKVIEDLENKNIFVIKFDTGIRIGLCSVPKKKIKGLAKKIKESIDKSKN